MQTSPASDRKTFMNNLFPLYHRLILALWVLVAPLALTGGCRPTSFSDPLNPDSSALQGEWLLQQEAGIDVSQKKIKPWIFTGNTVETFNESGTGTLMAAQLYRVGDDFFLDVSPYGLDGTDIGQILAIHVAPIHSFFRVRHAEKSLSLTPINLALLERGLQQKKINLPHLRAESEDHLLINANIKDWLGLIDQHKDEADFFMEEQNYLLVRSD